MGQTLTGLIVPFRYNSVPILLEQYPGIDLHGYLLVIMIKSWRPAVKILPKIGGKWDIGTDWGEEGYQPKSGMVWIQITMRRPRGAVVCLNLN